MSHSAPTLAPDPLEWMQPDLARLAALRLEPRAGASDWRAELRAEAELRLLEGEFLEAERAAVADRAAAAPRDPASFVSWFRDLREHGPGQGDPLFPWLARHASVDELRWFLRQEVAGEAGFDDLVALTQLKLPTRAKLELARNYWDEMGQGDERAMHGLLLGRIAAHLGVGPDTGPVVWESVALGHLLLGLAGNRRYAFHSVGALGAIELTAPTRAVHVNEALRRCGVSGSVRSYYALHATLDVQHADAWCREVLEPLVAEDPGRARPIAEGALMRLRAGARCFARYRRQLGLEA